MGMVMVGPYRMEGFLNQGFFIAGRHSCRKNQMSLNFFHLFLMLCFRGSALFKVWVCLAATSKLSKTNQKVFDNH